MKTKAYRRKLMAYLKSAAETGIESVKKTNATENEKKFVDQCYVSRWCHPCINNIFKSH